MRRDAGPRGARGVDAGAGLADLDEALYYGRGRWALIFLDGLRMRGAVLTQPCQEAQEEGAPVEIECPLESRYSTPRKDALSLLGLVIAVVISGMTLYLIGKLGF
jgi:hypothetical protein